MIVTVQSQSLTILIIASKYVLTLCIYCRTEPAERSHAARLGEEVTATTPREAYNLVNLSNEYEDLFAYQKQECETPIAQCPADTPINETPIAQCPADTPINKSGDEDVSETAQSS